MASIQTTYGTATSLSASGLNNLASGSMAAIASVDNQSALFLDALVEIVIDPGVTTGAKQAVVYAVSSVDGTNFSDPLNRTNMGFVGAIDLPDTNVVRSRAFSVAAAFGGVLPPEWTVYVFNDSGVAFAATGHSAQYRGVLMQSV